MKIYLDTSTSVCKLKIDNNEYSWESGKTLAEGLLNFISTKLAENGGEIFDIDEIVFFSGPGSFTGLRIGAAVVNTLADQLKIPLYNHRGERVDLILPEYGSPAKITEQKR